MTKTKRSDIISNSASPMMNLFRTGLLHGAGISAERIKTRPLIAIANPHTELTTGHSHLNRLAQKVHDGILAAGGACAEFNVPTPCDGVAMALKMKGLKKAAFITDGRFSGATSGSCVGQVCPETSADGPIALIEDGDLVEIDVPNALLTLHVDEATLVTRRAVWVGYERAVPHGYLRSYRLRVRAACEGAALD